ncbi:hypothetical protein BDZ94DRAFT_1314700 [Collybia nuda]|uniref:Uncharacterized protein n=1 Tax=Collybia nuda TaxID=64659 RepID=A0A9P5XWL5_9AGAR|nr:hypothetical protein BDZ94DRAFT_1314700 [Collybia nuda]
MRTHRFIFISYTCSAVFTLAIPVPLSSSHSLSTALRRTIQDNLVERNVDLDIPIHGVRVVAPKSGAGEVNFVDKVKTWTKERAEKSVKKPRIKTDRERAMTVRDLDIQPFARDIEHKLEGSKQVGAKAHSQPSPFDTVVHFYGSLRQRMMSDLD